MNGGGWASQLGGRNYYQADEKLSVVQRYDYRVGSGARVGSRSVLFLPNYRPPVTSAFTATEGTLWLRREEGRASVEYRIVDAGGTLRAALTVPANVTLLAARDDLAWGSETDGDGGPTIVRFRVRR